MRQTLKICQFPALVANPDRDSAIFKNILTHATRLITPKHLTYKEVPKTSLNTISLTYVIKYDILKIQQIFS